MNVIISCNLGRYDLCSTKKDWCLQMKVGDKPFVAAHFDEDDEPQWVDEPPSQIAEMIAERHAHYLYRTGQKEDDEILAYIRDNAEEIDEAWAMQKIAAYQRRIDQFRRYIRSTEAA